MKYNFDQIIDRSNTHAIKWMTKENELPMWIADMDFETAPAVKEAIINRASHGVYGYSDWPDEWADAYANWWKTRHHWDVDPATLVYVSGVIPAISTMVRRLSAPNENVVVQTPVYNMFFNCIRNNGRVILENPLKEYPDGHFEMDLEDLEKKLSDPQTSLMILCNPQNPIGIVWDRETLDAVGQLAAKYGVTVISDEIHCDLTRPGVDYIPFASVSETNARISAVCIAPSKTFNLAGLQSAAVSIADPVLRHRVWRALNTDEVAEPNAFEIDAVLAAYQKGADWVNALRTYVFANRDYVETFLAEKLPQVKLVPGDATYLLWLDIRGMDGLNADAIREKSGLWLSDGAAYRAPGFLRMNIACPRSMVEEGMRRLLAAVSDFENTK